MIARIKLYLVALLGILASLGAALKYRAEARFHKQRANQAEGAAQNIKDQHEVMATEQSRKQTETNNALTNGTHLNYFDDE